jgi:S1-C subfamily serine protease
MKAQTENSKALVSGSRRRVVQVIVLVLLLLGVVGMVHHAPVAALTTSRDDLQSQVYDLTVQVKQLRQEQAMPALVLNRYRNSIGYIYGVYHVGFANQRPEIRVRVSGTGFLVGTRLVATNRHLAQPWYGDSAAEQLIRRGATPTLETLVIFFPGSLRPVRLSQASISKTSDVAVLRAEDSEVLRGLPILPLAKSPASPGQFIDVIGYPMGIAGMVAKSPAAINELLAYRPSDIIVAKALAAKSLIRPLSTCGHLGDVIGDTLVYDAATAHGGSGGPVFNANGEVIGVNSAYIDGFSGASIGVSIQSLRPLLQEVPELSATTRP